MGPLSYPKDGHPSSWKCSPGDPQPVAGSGIHGRMVQLEPVNTPIDPNTRQIFQFNSLKIWKVWVLNCQAVQENTGNAWHGAVAYVGAAVGLRLPRDCRIPENHGHPTALLEIACSSTVEQIVFRSTKMCCTLVPWIGFSSFFYRHMMCTVSERGLDLC